jgi:partner of Y14 and mago protein
MVNAYKFILILLLFIGNTYIPATQRPDGTWRKPVKVKEGYVPADERPRYQCKAQIEATQRQGSSKFPIGWSPKELQKQANGIKEQRKQLEASNEPKNVPITQQDHIQKKIHGLQKKINDIDKLKVNLNYIYSVFFVYRNVLIVESLKIPKKHNWKSCKENPIC